MVDRDVEIPDLDARIHHSWVSGVLAPSGRLDHMEIDEAGFEELVGRALDGVPPELADLMDNVVVLIEPEPPAEDPDLLGLYDGIPLTERDSTYTFRPPDRIFVYRGPLVRMCTSAQELVEEVRITVVHEIAHHFGIDDRALHDLGYG